MSALIRLPNPIPPPGNFLEEAPTLEDLFISASSSSNKPSRCSTLGAVASTAEQNKQCIVKKSIVNNTLILFQISIVAKERKIALLREHVFTVFLLRL